jgi:predicted nucleic acid-binding protein
MEWLENVRGQIVGLDSAPLMYYLESHPDYIEMMRPFFAMVDKRECRVVTSVLTLLEVLVMPIRKNDDVLARKYYHICFDIENIKTISLSPTIAERAARIRAFYPSIKSPDAIQVATAISGGASFFLTNDAQLAHLPDIKVIVLKNLKKDS